MSKKKKLLKEATKLPDTDFLWGESLDAAFLTALVERLSKPIRSLPAYTMGLIDAQGKIIKEPKTKEERRALSNLDRVALFMRQSMGGRVMYIYNLYRRVRMNPAFVQAAARAKSLRFLKYYDLKIGFFEKPFRPPQHVGYQGTLPQAK